MSTKHKRLLMAVVVPEVVLAVLAWRDLARRTDDQVRGHKNFWRAFVTVNPGNSLVYWLVGRRRRTPVNRYPRGGPGSAAPRVDAPTLERPDIGLPLETH